MLLHWENSDDLPVPGMGIGKICLGLENLYVDWLTLLFRFFEGLGEWPEKCIELTENGCKKGAKACQKVPDGVGMIAGGDGMIAEDDSVNMNNLFTVDTRGSFHLKSLDKSVNLPELLIMQ